MIYKNVIKRLLKDYKFLSFLTIGALFLMCLGLILNNLLLVVFSGFALVFFGVKQHELNDEILVISKVLR